jgi:hypothetical protein
MLVEAFLTAGSGQVLVFNYAAAGANPYDAAGFRGVCSQYDCFAVYSRVDIIAILKRYDLVGYGY